MKIALLILAFCLGSVGVSAAQVPSKIKLCWPALKTDLSCMSFKSAVLINSPLYPLKKDLCVKYTPPKLPFFCSMEEKSRAKFGLFFKIRAGNDQDYRKLIKISSP
jgi:hypothetical protein